MKNTLVVIENDMTLDHADYVKAFMEEYDGEIIIMTGFRQKTKEEIINNVSKCTDIAVQSCFISGSEHQFAMMVGLLSKLKNPINVYIAYIGFRDNHQQELYDFIVDNTTPDQLASIEQHTIYAMSHDKYHLYDEVHIKLDFSDITAKTHKARTKKAVHDLYLEWYKETANDRKTGRKILVLGCTAHGNPFKNLPIGQEVDELDCHELSTGGISRGVWIQGNGEPIMLVNDHGFNEYKIVTKLSIEEIFAEIGKTTDVNVDALKRLEIEGILAVIKDSENDNMSKANFICEETGITKRSNRQKIYTLLNDNLVVS